MRTPVMHRERSEELAHRFHDEMREQGWDAVPWVDQPANIQEALTIAFDRLITDRRLCPGLARDALCYWPES